MVLSGLMPFGVWLVLALGLARRGRRSLDAMLLAAVLLGLVVTGLTEGLELLGGWARPGLLHGAWVLVLVAAVAFLLRTPASGAPLSACLPRVNLSWSAGLRPSRWAWVCWRPRWLWWPAWRRPAASMR